MCQNRHGGAALDEEVQRSGSLLRNGSRVNLTAVVLRRFALWIIPGLITNLIHTQGQLFTSDLEPRTKPAIGGGEVALSPKSQREDMSALVVLAAVPLHYGVRGTLVVYTLFAFL
jgi:hypothetical protein